MDIQIPVSFACGELGCDPRGGVRARRPVDTRSSLAHACLVAPSTKAMVLAMLLACAFLSTTSITAASIEDHVRVLAADETEEGESKIFSAMMLYGMSANDTIREEIASAGAIEPLVQMLGDMDVDVALQAATTLLGLAFCDSNKPRIVEAGGIAPLVELIQAGNSNATVRRMGAALIGVVANSDPVRKLIVEAGGLPPLLELLRVGDERLWSSVAYTIAELTKSEMVAEAVVGSDILEQLFKKVRDEGHDYGLREATFGAALTAIVALSKSDAGKAAILKADGAAVLVGRLASGADLSVQERTTLVDKLWTLGTAEEMRGPIADSGAIPHLLSLLRDDPSEITKEKAAGALGLLAHKHVGRQNDIRVAGGIKIFETTYESAKAKTLKQRIFIAHKQLVDGETSAPAADAAPSESAAAKDKDEV